MASKNVATPYAKALLEVAVDQNSLSKVRGDLTDFAFTVKKSSDLSVVLTNPTIDTAARKAVVQAIARKMALSKLTTNFLSLLADKRRLNIVEAIAAEFRAMADAKAGVVRAEVESAVALTPAQESKLKMSLQKLTGKKVLVETKVDDRLIGGLSVRVDGKLYDGTVRTHFENIREAILQDL